MCGQVGQLPPISEDCQTLVNAVTILNGQIGTYQSACMPLSSSGSLIGKPPVDPDFTVESNHVQTISFGTCRFFFENVSPQPLTYCWLSLVRLHIRLPLLMLSRYADLGVISQAQVASAAAAQCLPPNQPVLSEGLCIARDSTWEVG